MCNMTRDMWHLTCFEDNCTKVCPTYWINKIINYKGVCRTALATPGLLNTQGLVKIMEPIIQNIIVWIFLNASDSFEGLNILNCIIQVSVQTVCTPEQVRGGGRNYGFVLLNLPHNREFCILLWFEALLSLVKLIKKEHYI